MRASILVLAFLSLLGCQPPQDDRNIERATIIILTKRMMRLEKKVRMKVPPEEQIHIYEANAPRRPEANKT